MAYISSYKSAAAKETDAIKTIKDNRKTMSFCKYLLGCKTDVETLTAHHLGLASGQRCVMLGLQEWIAGRFNVCIPVSVTDTDGTCRKVMMRCAIPHMMAEDTHPGTIEEKMRCEVATYAYFQEECPEIPIPHLFGFCLPDGQKFTHSKHLSIYRRLGRQFLRWFCAVRGKPIPSQYLQHPDTHKLKCGYILLEYIEKTTGTLISETWDQHWQDEVRRRNLFRGLSRLRLAVSRKAWPRIGSLTFYNDGTYDLDNRPLSATIAILESNGAKRIIDQNQTFDTVEPYIADLLSYHEDRFLQQPNGATDELDCQRQMAVMFAMRSIAHHFFQSKLRHGPFHLYPTDDHQYHFFVDEDWNITKFFDLEFFCSQPVQMCYPPHWITGLGVDQLYGSAYDEFDRIQQEYFRVFEEEEAKLHADQRFSQTMKASFKDGTFWFNESLQSINAMYNIFERHLRPIYGYNAPFDKETDSVMSNFFSRDARRVVLQKLKEKEQYDIDLKKLFPNQH